ncbi:MAG: recombinase family protein [Subdoligranulum variabile]|nr:recombinase family protein [Subdoligranulum variabile]
MKNRPGFQEMAAAAEAKKLDIIICKSISRFSRNMVDCQQYAKWFRTLGVTIIFEEQNIRTDDPTCDFVLSILAAVAQDESHSISENEKAA